MDRAWLRAAVVGIVVAVATPLVAVPSAEATFFGRNGDIAFRRFLNEDRTWGAVFMIRPDGTGERQVTFPPEGVVDRNPDISPDGRRIVFQRETVTCDVDCSYEIFVVDVDGSNLAQLTRNPPGVFCGQEGGACNFAPGWSPDGKQIVLSRATGPVVDDLIENMGIAVMDADGSDLRMVTQRMAPSLGEDQNPQWSPDGRRIVFDRINIRGVQPEFGRALWIVDLRTGREHRVTPYELDACDTPDWSPTGAWILFHDNCSGNPDLPTNLFKILPNGRGLTQITFEPAGGQIYLGASWSPDGRFIVTGRRPETGGVNADIFILRRDGSDIRPLTQTQLYDSYPDWGPLPRRHA